MLRRIRSRFKLQWGRVLMNAETGRVRYAHQLVKEGLQWGRVLMNAETAALVSPAPEVFSLQWGRVLMNAET